MPSAPPSRVVQRCLTASHSTRPPEGRCRHPAAAPLLTPTVSSTYSVTRLSDKLFNDARLAERLGAGFPTDAPAPLLVFIAGPLGFLASLSPALSTSCLPSRPRGWRHLLLALLRGVHLAGWPVHFALLFGTLIGARCSITAFLSPGPDVR